MISSGCGLESYLRGQIFFKKRQGLSYHIRIAGIVPATLSHTLIFVLRYAITDRQSLPGSEEQQQVALVQQVEHWAAEGVDYIQLREKDLSAFALSALARRILEALCGASTKLLINSRADVAVAADAHGVHLTADSNALTPDQVRQIYADAGLNTPIVSMSCHRASEADLARTLGADLILFAPVFQKSVARQLVAPGHGLAALRAACAAAAPVPVIALGGVTHENAGDCVQAGAAGVAGIRLFQNL